MLWLSLGNSTTYLFSDVSKKSFSLSSCKRQVFPPLSEEYKHADNHVRISDLSGSVELSIFLIKDANNTHSVASLCCPSAISPRSRPLMDRVLRITTIAPMKCGLRWSGCIAVAPLKLQLDRVTMSFHMSFQFSSSHL